MTRSGHSVTVEVEVHTLDESCQALRSGAERIMLDNTSIPQLRDVIAHRHPATTPNVVLEASGTITLPTARAIAETCVNALSVGALTHNAFVSGTVKGTSTAVTHRCRCLDHLSAEVVNRQDSAVTYCAASPAKGLAYHVALFLRGR
jgi:nicotinate-nucleotide pyrophosphorylase (carboxylating)